MTKVELAKTLREAIRQNDYHNRRTEEEKAQDIARLGHPDGRKRYHLDKGVRIFMSEDDARTLLAELEAHPGTLRGYTSDTPDGRE